MLVHLIEAYDDGQGGDVEQPSGPRLARADVLWERSDEGLSLSTRFAARPLPNGNTAHELTNPDKDPPQRIAVCLDQKVGPAMQRMRRRAPFSSG